MTPATEIIDGQVWLRGELLQLALANPSALVGDPAATLTELTAELALPDGADATTTYAHLVALRQAKAEGLVTRQSVQRRVSALASVLLGGEPKAATGAASKPRKASASGKAKAAPKPASANS